MGKYCSVGVYRNEDTHKHVKFEIVIDITWKLSIQSCPLVHYDQPTYLLMYVLYLNTLTL